MDTRELSDTWPPTIDWDLLKRDPSAPREFLKCESWKLLLGSRKIVNDDSNKPIVTVKVHVPGALKGVSELWLDLMIRPQVRRALRREPFLNALSARDLDLEYVELAGLDSEVQRALQLVFRERELQQWLRLFVKGLHFAAEIGRPNQDRYVFIEEIYYPTVEFKNAHRVFIEGEARPLLITGVPRAGKTYTALRLLYDILEDTDALIKFVSWSDPQEILDIAEEAKSSQCKLFAVMDDPFGIDEYIEDTASTSIQVIQTLEKKYPEVRLLMTSREEIYSAALRERTELHSFKFSTIEFAPEEIGKNTNLYPEVLERTAWLHGANWRKYLNTSVNVSDKQTGVSEELLDAWRTVFRESYVPGVLLSAFILYPEIVNLDLQEPADVRNLALALGSAVDVGAAFRSELDALLKDASNEKILYLLLPSFTLVQEDTLAIVFSADERRRLGSDLDRYFEQTSEGDFAVFSYRYKLDVFAEVAQGLLEDEGLMLLERSILPELEDRVSRHTDARVAEVLSDVLSRYFWLGGHIGNQHVITLMQSLSRQSKESVDLALGRERDRIYILGALFQKQEPRLRFDLLVEKLMTADPHLVSSVASMLDQLLSNELREKEAIIKRIAGVVGELHGRYFRSSDPKASALQASLLLHGILSHLEMFFVPVDEVGLGRPSKEWDRENGILRDLLGTNHLLTLIQNREPNWAFPAIMWLDAIIMKLGELRLYLVEHKIAHDVTPAENREGTSGVPDHVMKQNVACGILYSWLFDELQEVTRAINRQGSSSDIAVLGGGLLFTLTWHNRWCLKTKSSQELNEIAQWAETDNWWKSPAGNIKSYWEGLSFNLDYHARYFEVKASAWQRESAIYRIHEKAPRLGADTPHESGLPSDMLREDWRERFGGFYEFCLNRLMPLNSEANDSHDDISSAAFLLGMRSPRDHELRDKYVFRIHESLYQRVQPWHEDLWRAISKLFAFNLRDSIDFIKLAIRPGSIEMSHDRAKRILAVVDSVEERFKTSGARYASRSLDLLRKMFETRER